MNENEHIEICANIIIAFIAFTNWSFILFEVECSDGGNVNIFVCTIWVWWLHHIRLGLIFINFFDNNVTAMIIPIGIFAGLSDTVIAAMVLSVVINIKLFRRWCVGVSKVIYTIARVINVHMHAYSIQIQLGQNDDPTVHSPAIWWFQNCLRVSGYENEFRMSLQCCNYSLIYKLSETSLIRNIFTTSFSIRANPTADAIRNTKRHDN